MNSLQKISFKFYYSPRKNLGKGQFSGLLEDMREVAVDCFGQVPHYQIFSGEEKEGVDNIIVVAYEGSKAIGFTSSLLLDAYNKKILHLGLTCVRAEFRGLKLSQKLYTKLITNYCFRYSLFSKIWVSNLACVLSSLGNVAKNFEEVYPSPRYQVCPSLEHFYISHEINEKYRNELYIPSYAVFDPDKNVFQNSVKETIFEKGENDQRFYHRMKLFNVFYKKLMNFDRGDEVLQVGHLSAWTILRRSIKISYSKFYKKVKTPLALENRTNV